MHKVLLRCPVKVEADGLRTWDLPLLDGADYHLIKDEGSTMVVLVTACSNPAKVNKPKTASQWATIKSTLVQAPNTELATHPDYTGGKVGYGPRNSEETD